MKKIIKGHGKLQRTASMKVSDHQLQKLITISTDEFASNCLHGAVQTAEGIVSDHE